MSQRSKEFEDQIAAQLEGAGFNLQREPALGGLRPDFLVEGPRGQRVVVETKAWDPRGGNTARALDQVRFYQEATGVDRVFLVLPELKKNFRTEGVIGPEALVGSLQSFFEGGGRSGRRTKSKPKATRRTVFAAMPFDRAYDDTFFVAMTYAAEKNGSVCERVDRTEFSGDIVAEIRRLIAKCIAVIADLSEGKPNVLYEAGYAHALKKPAVHICSTPLSELPFDVRNWNTLEYRRGQTTSLRDPLARRLKAVVR